MSIFLADPIQCERCARVNEVETPRSVNAGRSPHHRAAVLAGTFQAFRCALCETPFRVEPAFFYIDLGRKQWYGVFPPSAEPAWRHWEQATRYSVERGVGDDAPAIARAWREGLATRVVFGVAALREKLIAHDAGIDDRWLELAKLAWMREPDGPGLDLDEARLRLIAADPQQLVLAAGARRFEVPRARLDELARDPQPWRALRDELDATIFVDVARLLLPGDAAAA